MTWKHFFDFTLDMMGAMSFGALMGLGIFSLASLLDDVLRALRRWWKGKNTSPPAPLPIRRGEGGSGRGAGDDHDLDGGVGGAPVCP